MPRCILWSCYLDRTKTRAQGRRIPISIALENPSIQEILEASSKLGLNPELIPKSYPRSWWDQNQAVILDKPIPKQQLLKQIAAKIQEQRASKHSSSRSSR